MKKTKKPKTGKLVSKKTEPDKRDNTFLILLFIIAAGFVLRLIFFFETSGSPLIQNLYSDSKIYFDWAKHIVNSGNWLGGEVFFMSPFYPYFLAINYSIFNDAVSATRIIQVLISSVNIYIIFLVARNLYSKNAGLIAAALASIYSVFIFYSGLILLETLQAFVISLLLYFITKKIDIQNLKKHWLISGLLLGIAALFRANILLFLPAAALWIFLSYRKNEELKIVRFKVILFFLLGTLIPILPVTIRNYAVSGDFVLITSNGGINFYLGNNKDALGIFKTPEDFDLFSDMSGEKFAEKELGKQLSASEASEYWFERGLNYIISNPGDAAELYAKKTGLFFSWDENPQSDIMDPGFYRDNSSDILKLPLINYAVILCLAAIGIILTWKKRKQYSLLYVFIISYIISVILFFVIGRFRLGIAPVLIAFAAIAVLEVINAFKEKNYKAVFISVAVAVIYITANAFIIPSYNFKPYNAYLNIGITQLEKGEVDKAIANFNKSLGYRDYYMTHVSLGNALAIKKDFKGAYVQYRKAIQLKDDYAPAYFNMGSMFAQSGRLKDALASFNKTLELDSTMADAYRNRAIIYYMIEDYNKSLVDFRKYLNMVDDPRIKKSVKSDIEEIKRRLGEKQ